MRIVLLILLALFSLSSLLAGNDLSRERRAALREYSVLIAERGRHLSMENTARALSAPCQNDREKAWTLASWIAQAIRYSTTGGDSYRSQESDLVFRRRGGVCAGYSKLFEEMGIMMGLDARYVTGKVKIDNEIVPDSHAWNKVFLSNGGVIYLDTTWMSGYGADEEFQRVFKPEYFDIPPSALVFTHYEEGFVWDDRDLLWDDFRNLPYAENRRLRLLSEIMRALLLLRLLENGSSDENIPDVSGNFSPDAEHSPQIIIAPFATTLQREKVYPILIDMKGMEGVNLEFTRDIPGTVSSFRSLGSYRLYLIYFTEAGETAFTVTYPAEESNPFRQIFSYTIE